MRVEFFEDIEKSDTDRPSGRHEKKRSMSLIFVQGLGRGQEVFIEDCGSSVHVLSGIQELARTKTRPRCYYLEQEDLDVAVSRADGRKYTYDSYVWSFSPGLP